MKKKLFDQYTPPVWVRHFIPWFVIHWIDDHYDVCWTNLFTWKHFGSDVSWWPSEICFHPYDYCNKFPERGTEQRKAK